MVRLQYKERRRESVKKIRSHHGARITGTHGFPRGRYSRAYGRVLFAVLEASGVRRYRTLSGLNLPFSSLFYLEIGVDLSGESLRNSR